MNEGIVRNPNSWAPAKEYSTYSFPRTGLLSPDRRSIPGAKAETGTGRVTRKERTGLISIRH
jgi:hypothetical protein